MLLPSNSVSRCAISATAPSIVPMADAATVATAKNAPINMSH
nr:tetratricopeptide repeat protein 19 [Hymenolepis microstoma]